MSEGVVFVKIGFIYLWNETICTNKLNLTLNLEITHVLSKLYQTYLKVYLFLALIVWSFFNFSISWYWKLLNEIFESQKPSQTALLSIEKKLHFLWIFFKKWFQINKSLFRDMNKNTKNTYYLMSSHSIIFLVRPPQNKTVTMTMIEHVVKMSRRISVLVFRIAKLNAIAPLKPEKKIKCCMFFSIRRLLSRVVFIINANG